MFLYMSVKVVDLNEDARQSLASIRDATKEAEPAPAIDAQQSLASIRDEAPKDEIANEIVDEVNEVIEDVVEDVVEEVEKPQPKAKAKPKASDIVQCEKCFRRMTYKNLRYSHKCYDEPQPVKKQTNPKSKAKPKAPPKQAPKPPPDVYYSSSEEEAEAVKPVKAKQPPKQPQQPQQQAMSFAEQYQLLQQQMVQQKRDRYNSISTQMFGTRSKRR